MLSLLVNKSSSRRQPGDFRTDVEVLSNLVDEASPLSLHLK
ncbi:hypothetical protein [Streptomyces shenzhenensis]|nr:hypothetical protein [Streptomyces shenzhenensis]